MASPLVRETEDTCTLRRDRSAFYFTAFLNSAPAENFGADQAVYLEEIVNQSLAANAL